MSKFMGVVRSASDALSKSIIRIVNKMIIFDEIEYKKLSSAQYKLDDIPDDIQEKKKQLYDENLDDMRSILEKMKKVLLEVDHLMMECLTWIILNRILMELPQRLIDY